MNDMPAYTLTLKMTSAQVVETSVIVTLNSPSQDYTHPDDRTPLSYDMTPGFKPFTTPYIGNIVSLSSESLFSIIDDQKREQTIFVYSTFLS